MKIILILFLLTLCSCKVVQKNEVNQEIIPAKNIVIPTEFENNSKWSDELHLIILKAKEFSDVLPYSEWIESNHFVSKVGCGDFINHPSFELSGGKCFDISIEFKSQNKNWMFLLSFRYKDEQIHMVDFRGYSFIRKDTSKQ